MDNQKHILLGICGSISAYKTLEFVRLLRKNNYTVTCMLSEHAKLFVTKESLSILSEGDVIDSLHSDTGIKHLDLSKTCDAFLILPGSANTLSKLSLGLADDIISTTWLNFTGPKLIAPSMHTDMWENALIQEHVNRLIDHGCFVIPPALGPLACGDYGAGRLPELSTIYTVLISSLFSKEKLLAGKNIFITAGPMQVVIDPVRVLQNKSSGNLGHLLAHMCAALGANVHLLTSKTISDPQCLSQVDVFDSFDSFKEALKQSSHADLFFMSAAVSDYTYDGSLKKLARQDQVTLTLKGTKDLLKESKSYQKATCCRVGFCLIDDLTKLDKAKAKKKNKDVDLMLVNTPSAFGAPSRDVVLIDSENKTRALNETPLEVLCFDLIQTSLAAYLKKAQKAL